MWKDRLDSKSAGKKPKSAVCEKMHKCSQGQLKQILPPPTLWVWLCLSRWYSQSVSAASLPWMLRSRCGVQQGFDPATMQKGKYKLEKNKKTKLGPSNQPSHHGGWWVMNRFQGYVMCWCFSFLLNANTSVCLSSRCHGDPSIVMQHIMQHQDQQNRCNFSCYISLTAFLDTWQTVSY